MRVMRQRSSRAKSHAMKDGGTSPRSGAPRRARGPRPGGGRQAERAAPPGDAGPQPVSLQGLEEADVRIPAAEFAKAAMAGQTVNGKSVKITAGKSGVTVDNAKVVKTDIECSNGVIHVIDSVIIPK